MISGGPVGLGIRDAANSASKQGDMGVKPPPGSVHKVLNNNLVVTIDPLGREQILMGRGLGFHLKPQSAIDYSKVEKTFVLDRDTDHARIEQLFVDVPMALIDAVTEAAEEAGRVLGREFGGRLPVALIDHVHFVLMRMREGIQFPPSSMPELGVLYPDESAAAIQMRDSIGKALGVRLPEEEAGFLAMHLLAVTRDNPSGTAALLFSRVRHVVLTVEKALSVTLDSSTSDYARFVLHLKFLLQRIMSETMLHGSDGSFFEFARRNHPESYGVAEDIRNYVFASTKSMLTDEEMLYLTMHVERLRQRVVPFGARDK